MNCPRCGHITRYSLFEKIIGVIIILTGILTSSCLGYFLYIQNADRRKYIVDSAEDRKEVMQVIEDFKTYGRQNWVHQELGEPIKKGGK